MTTRLARLLRIDALALVAASIVAALALVVGAAAVAQNLQPVPPLKSRVTDLTGTLDASARARIEAALEAFERRKGSQLAVLMVPTTAPEPIESYSIRVADAWKIGRGRVDGKRVDDGVLLVVAKDDRRVRIEVGYGLEGAIPDARANRIIDGTIAPRFRQGDFAGGIEAALNDLMRLIDGETLPEPAVVAPAGQGQAQGDAGGGWLPLVLGAVVIGLVLRQVLGRFLGSSVGAALGGGVLWATGAGFILAVLAGVFLFMLLLAMGTGASMGPVGGRHTWRSGPVIWPGGFGGRGGGFGGGGFRGGGGGFGGGGASGGW